MSTAEIILNYTENRDRFTLAELSEYVRNRESISDAGILWHVKKLVKDDRLSKVARGIYEICTKNKKQVYKPQISGTQKDLFSEIKTAFPLIDVCTYSGAEISAMQHHVSLNKAYYIEVTKEATEAVFHWLVDKGIKAYHKPTEEFMSEYINLSEECVIVKSLITESPLIKIDGVSTPTLEKLLVDINKDPDFYYLKGSETFYIIDYARSMYQINESKMLRYASRRGIRKEMIDIFNHQEP